MFRFVLHLFLILALFSGFTFSSCTENDATPPPNQEIVYFDTSAVTGQLWVDVIYYNDLANDFYAAPPNTKVHLFASTNDIDLGLPLYHLQTVSSNQVYFGYINYGNYYVLAFNDINGFYYEGIGVVQVRPGREELLTLTMYKLP